MATNLRRPVAVSSTAERSHPAICGQDLGAEPPDRPGRRRVSAGGLLRAPPASAVEGDQADGKGGTGGASAGQREVYSVLDNHTEHDALLRLNKILKER